MPSHASVFTPWAVEIIRRLAEQGKTSTEIADVLGSTPGSVRVKCCQFKIKLHRQRRTKIAAETQHLPKRRLVAHLQPTTYTGLKQKADHRQTSPVELAGMLLEAVVTSAIYEAVLDKPE